MLERLLKGRLDELIHDVIDFIAETNDLNHRNYRLEVRRQLVVLHVPSGKVMRIKLF